MTLPGPVDDEVRFLLQAVWDQLAAGEHWPAYRAVDRVLHQSRRLDIDALLVRTSEELLAGGRRMGNAPPQDTQQLSLTIAGVASCKGTEQIVEAFLRAVRTAGRLENEVPVGEDEPAMTADQVIEGASDGGTQRAMPAAASMARQLGLLLVTEPWAGSSSLYEGGWNIRVTRRIRAYADISTLDEYWDLRTAQRELPQRTSFDEPGTATSRPVPIPHDPPAPSSIFVVHGRDDTWKEQVARLLERTTGRNVVVLHEQANRGATLLEKFERHAQEAGFAVVLLTGDDEGRLRNSGSDLNLRGRQNVIFELGVFIGSLGRSKVAVLVDPAVEHPSDLDGLVYIPIGDNDSWKHLLLRELEAASISVAYDRIP